MKINSIVLVSFVLCVCAFNSVAQTRCPQGVQPGAAQCLPDDGQSAPARPTGEWIKTWGAVVGSDHSGEAWTTVGKLTKEDAEDEAVSECKKAGASDCRIRISYQNQCVAMASPVAAGGTATVGGKSKEVAGRRALSICQKNNNSECTIIYSDCTAPIFNKY
ncbi:MULTISPECIES: DUF4189 domain-containing protein [Xanthomonas]|uniref:DUF4189 domain-containing protein n=1 Tax=Xanthomonas TaxID=338 RepID=UPI001CC5819F|nr:MULTISPECIES: DUF4189 domain-containing protein [Xanthomonas]